MINNRKRLLLILGFSLIVVLGACGKGGGADTTQNGPDKTNSTVGENNTDFYHIGIVAQLSGPAAAYGIPTIEGMEYQVKLLNERKFTKKPIKLEIQNDESKESQTVAITNRFIADNKILALGGFTSSSLALAAKPIVNDKGITQLVWSTSDKISNPLGKWTFQIIPTAITQAETAMKFFQNKGIKKVAIIHEKGDFGDSWNKGVIEGAGNYQLEVALNETAVIGEKDFSVMISKVKSSGAEGLFVAGSTPMSASVASAIKQLQLNIPVVNGSGGTTTEFAKLAGPDGVGLYGISTGLAGMEDSLVEGPLKDKLLAMRDEYMKATGKKIDMMQSGGITMIDLFAIAIKNAEEKYDSVTRENIRNEIENIKGVDLWVGSYNYNDADHLGVTNATPLMLNKDQKWELYLTTDQVREGKH